MTEGFCRNCGAQRTPGADFCANCGTPAPASTPAAAPPQQQATPTAPWAAKAAVGQQPPDSPAAPRRGLGTVGWSVLGVLVVAALIAGLVVFLSGSDDDNTAAAADRTSATSSSTQERESDETRAPRTREDDEPSSSRPTRTVSPRPLPSTPPAPAAGSLDVGVEMTPPACDGSWVVFLGAATEPATYASDIRALLNSQPNAKYLVTQGSCTSMRQALDDGTLIYTVYIGPYADQTTACAARAAVGGAAYVKRMDNATPPDQTWQC
ncbi:zinc ribbon domain-containing protein [Candidatus Blastococcus massiliensis]|uniref:zinc ribbon domain-containing protein n=1 Tax=Candidatus Blastococcus massiliensis TaxID=1470358 RepID=UPI0004B72F71|nr:zinc ribbon domain-containing protein [Candidatus Blastococcus massiliensis]